MKKLLVCAFLLGSTLTFAQEEIRCGMPQGFPCKDFYSKLDAFKRIQENENTLEDAKGNLALIDSVQKKLGLNLEYIVDNFIYIQWSVGGSGSTNEARQAFNSIVNEINKQNQLHDVAEKFVSLAKEENGFADAQGDFSLVVKYVRSGQVSFQIGTQLFLSVLNLEGGSSKTSEARDTFIRLMNYINEFKLKDLFDSYRLMSLKENSHLDALGNFEIVLLAARKCGSLEQATSDFIQVLKQVGGSGKTSEARLLFRTLYDI